MKDGIIPLNEIPALPSVLSNLDTTKAKETLGFGECVVTEKKFKDPVDNLLALEKLWAKAA